MGGGTLHGVRPYRTIWQMARTQTLVQLSDELLSRLDARVAREGRSATALGMVTAEPWEPAR